MRNCGVLLLLACAAFAQERSFEAAVEAVYADDFDRARAALPEEPAPLAVADYAALGYLGRDAVAFLAPSARPIVTGVLAAPYGRTDDAAAVARLARDCALRDLLLGAYAAPDDPRASALQKQWRALLASGHDWVAQALYPDEGAPPSPAVQAQVLIRIRATEHPRSAVAGVVAGLWSPHALVRDRATRTARALTERLDGRAEALPFRLPDGDPEVIVMARKLILAADPNEEEADRIVRALERALGGMETAVPLGRGNVEPAPEFETAGDEAKPTEVVVYYGTDRAVFFPSAFHYALQFIWAGVAVLAALLLPRFMRWAFQDHLLVLAPITRWLAWAAAVFLVLSGAYESVRTHQRHERLGFDYGGRRGPFNDPEGPYCHFGTCVVGIPPQHVSGEVERPQPLAGDLWEDPDKHVLVLAIRPEKDATRFFTAVRERAESGDNSAFVFVHGFNVTFEDAALRTAQMTHDLNFQGAPIFFSWPSRGALLGYTYDESTVAWATRHLKRFLRDVRKSMPTATIHLVAHSMGNRALTEALRRLAREIQHEGLPRFQEVVLAAPDIDGATFRNDIAPAIRATAERITLYASSEDEALVASKQVHGYPRAGDSGERIVVVDGIETIDVCATLDSSVLGHSYYGSVGRVLDDLVALLRSRKKPEERGLAAVPGESGTFWRLE